MARSRDVLLAFLKRIGYVRLPLRDRKRGITATVRDERLLSSYVVAQVEDLWTALHQTVPRT